MLHIAINNQQRTLKLNRQRLRAAIKEVLRGEGIASGEISLAIVDDPAIHELNRRWLAHDEPTDVLSFILEKDDSRIEGEIIVSADTAVRRAVEFNWPPDAELLLYVIHGLLHLAGYDDREPTARAQMRDRERFYLQRLGIQVGSGFRVQDTDNLSQ